MLGRRNASSCGIGINDVMSKDAVFMEKISKALTTVHETYGYKAVQDCLEADESTGQCNVDLEVLCVMLDRSRSRELSSLRSDSAHNSSYSLLYQESGDIILIISERLNLTI